MLQLALLLAPFSCPRSNGELPRRQRCNQGECAAGPGAHASTSTRGSVSFSVASIGMTTSLCDFSPASQQALWMTWQPTSCSFARSPPMRHFCACSPCSSRYAKHLAPGVPSDFCRRWRWQSPCCITGRSSRTLVLMRNSVSSNFSSPPNWERRAATSF